MKTFLKWAGIALLALAVIATGAIYFLISQTNARFEKKHVVEVREITIPTDSASLARGEVWAKTLCSHCHGVDFAGTEFFNEPDIAVLNAPNITPGTGGAGNYTDEDWLKLIRHGIKKDGAAAFIMPSKDFSNLSDEDAGELIAYLKAIPPVDKEWAEMQSTTMAKVLLGIGAFGDVFNAETIDHSKVGGNMAPEVSSTAEYGDYLVSVIGCRSCHGEKLNGAPGHGPNDPFMPNITPGGNFGKWDHSQFIQAMRTGTTPEGVQMNNKFMPWFSLSNLNDNDLTAIFNYLKEQPTLATAEVN